MSISPRKTELEPVMALLTRDDFESPKAMAREIVKQVFESLQQREELWCVWHAFSPGGPVSGYGPFSGPSDAERWAKKQLPPGQCVAMRLKSPMVIDAKAIATIKEATPQFCDSCSHPEHTHLNTGYGGKCAQRNCTCTKFREAKEAA